MFRNIHAFNYRSKVWGGGPSKMWHAPFQRLEETLCCCLLSGCLVSAWCLTECGTVERIERDPSTSPNKAAFQADNLREHLLGTGDGGILVSVTCPALHRRGRPGPPLVLPSGADNSLNFHRHGSPVDAILEGVRFANMGDYPPRYAVRHV